MNDTAQSVITDAVRAAMARGHQPMPIIGIAGPQGSGKSTLARAIAATMEGVLALSLDDFYLSQSRRTVLAAGKANC